MLHYWAANLRMGGGICCCMTFSKVMRKPTWLRIQPDESESSSHAPGGSATAPECPKALVLKRLGEAPAVVSQCLAFVFIGGCLGLL